jgi:hypothetical protein
VIRVLRTAYYLTVSALLTLAATDRLETVFPAELAKDIGEDSEALLLALVLAAWIELARPRLLQAAHAWALTTAAAAACLLLGSVMFFGHTLPRSVATFSEPMLALALLLPYLQLRRPLPRRLVAGVPLAALLLIVLAFDSLDAARASEALAWLVLVPIGLDVVDRRILEPSEHTSTVLRWSWYLLLITAPVVLSDVVRDTLGGLPGQAVSYAIDVQEAWLGLLLLHLYAALTSSARPGSRVPAGAAPQS